MEKQWNDIIRKKPKKQKRTQSFFKKQRESCCGTEQVQQKLSVEQVKAMRRL